jgi:hypothetical protein
VRGWTDDSPDRIAIAAVALEALRRPRQALALYRRAIEVGYTELVKQVRPRLDALAALDRDLPSVAAAR